MYCCWVVLVGYEYGVGVVVVCVELGFWVVLWLVGCVVGCEVYVFGC